MTLLVVALVVVVVLVAAVAFADRALTGLAERRASAYAATPLGHDARVRVHGSPFLTQAVRGRYGDVEITASEFTLGVFERAALHAHLVNALLPLRALLGRRVSELPVELVHGEVVLPYDQLARVSRVPGLRFSYRDERLHATASLPVPGIAQFGIGQLAQVGGEAVGTLDDAGRVWLRVRNVSVAGISLPALVLNQLVPALTFPIPLPPLPYGLRIEQLTPTAAGLQVSGSARAVVLRSPARPADPTP